MKQKINSQLLLAIIISMCGNKVFKFAAEINQNHPREQFRGTPIIIDLILEKHSFTFWESPKRSIKCLHSHYIHLISHIVMCITRVA